MTGDRGNVYLNAETRENIYTREGTELKLAEITEHGNILEVIKEMYGFTTIGNRWLKYLSNNLRVMGFKTTRFEPNVCIKGRKGGWN